MQSRRRRWITSSRRPSSAAATTGGYAQLHAGRARLAHFHANLIGGQLLLFPKVLTKCVESYVLACPSSARRSVKAHLFHVAAVAAGPSACVAVCAPRAFMAPTSTN
jgi:hypothetical protein